MSITLKQKTAASIPTPAAGKKSIFLDSADDLIKTKDDAGVVEGFEGEANTASNLGTGADGENVFDSKSGVDLRFKRLKAGSNVTLTPQANDILISSTDTGEVNTASNLGTGADGENVFDSKSGVDLRFKRLKAGIGVTLTPETNDIIISSGSPELSTATEIVEDFITGAADPDELGSYTWAQSVAGTGATIARIPGESGRPGIIRMQPGTAIAARSMIYLGLSGDCPILLGGGAITCENSVRVTGLIATGFQRINVGLAVPNTANGQNTDGVFFRVVAGGTNWRFITRSGGVETDTDTGIAYASTAWNKFKFVVNAAGTSIEAFVNGASIGTVTTNIPTVALAPILKSDAYTGGGATNCQFDADYYYFKQIFTTAR